MPFLVYYKAMDHNKNIQIMGIVNVTPDSFSDGGQVDKTETLLAQVERMVGDGVDIIDIGGESTRPFAKAISLEEELNRVIPAIQSIRKHFSIPISIDTTKAEVARKAIETGADIINDISALAHDPGMITVATSHNVPVIIMHMQGTPQDMQKKPTYDNVITDICNSLTQRISWAEANGLSRDKIIIDPGLGFGKTIDHNLTILKDLAQFTSLGCPVLVGHSRKSFIGTILSEEDPKHRDEATAIISALCAMQGASFLRVHDVKRTVQAVKIALAIANAKV